MPAVRAAYSRWRPDAIEEADLVCLQVKQKDSFNCYYHTITPTTPGNYNLFSGYCGLLLPMNYADRSRSADPPPNWR